MNSCLRSLALIALAVQYGHASSLFHIYAPNREAQGITIVQATESDDGLALKIAEEVDLGFSANAITAHPDEPVLYVAGSGGKADDVPGAIVSLNPDGLYASHNPMKLAHGYCYISLDRTNGFLLGADYGRGYVDVYALDDSRTLGKRTMALNEGRRNAHCVWPSPNNRFAYVPYVKDANAIYQYAFSPESGRLTPLEPMNAKPPEGTGPRHIAYHPTKPLIYFSNEQHLGLSVYAMQESGQLELVQVCDAVEPGTQNKMLTTSDIAMTPDSRFLFSAIRDDDGDFERITRFRMKPDGQVEFLGLTPADDIPWGLATSPDGRYLLVAARGGESLTAYRIDEDGGLTQAARLDWGKKVTDLVTR